MCRSKLTSLGDDSELVTSPACPKAYFIKRHQTGAFFFFQFLFFVCRCVSIYFPSSSFLLPMHWLRLARGISRSFPTPTKCYENHKSINIGPACWPGRIFFMQFSSHWLEQGWLMKLSWICAEVHLLSTEMIKKPNAAIEKDFTVCKGL